ncbi:hypothetical protein EB118_25345 [bacterium]|nr:hypothetical protein [Synechococcaceae bacterium WB6_1A_059]NDG33369.1 hypothetical protein [bacterium]NDG79891.1 hypothetical protein [Synechococcaceae bacterium WB8_1B_057]
MSKIYESPDGGHTIYERTPNSTKRVLISEDEYAIKQKQKIEWAHIWEIKDTNPALQKAAEHVIMLYKLTEGTNEQPK